MRYLAVFGGLVVLVLLVALVLERSLTFTNQPRFVITFSAPHARSLGLEPEAVYQAILQELKPKHVRLQANWNGLEPEPGDFGFGELDALINQAGSAGATVTLALGRKLPHWPECHDPAWLATLSNTEVEERLLSMLTVVVERYRANPVVVRWQLENEPLFVFGLCPPPNWHLLRRERDLVKSLDPSRPILVTDSGELSPWLETALLADEQGTTLYRTTWSRWTGYFRYPLPAAFYRLKAALVSPFVHKVVVSELQLEPWSPAGLANLSLAEAQRSFSLDQFSRNVAYARRTGLPEMFVWGAEWWYYAKERLGEPAYWEAGQDLFD